jgi:cytochrome c-type biogenesis protein CcmF
MLFIGKYSLYFAWIFTIFSFFLYLLSLRSREIKFKISGDRAIYSSTFLIFVSTGVLIHAFITDNFRLEYVAHHSNRALPLLYKISALWGGQEGSLLFWTLVLALFIFTVVRERKPSSDPYIWVNIILSFSLFFFLTLNIFATYPFKLIDKPVSDGVGLNPLLQNIWMILHPPTLYAGYAGWSIPFAYAIASLFSKKFDVDWVLRTRKWALLSWILLTLGIFLGGRWAYVELGWGGYWGWDPVENSSLLPWLTGTAFLHSLLVYERRKSLLLWTLILAFLTYFLVILATYLARGGASASVHAFAGSILNTYLLIYLAFITTVFLLLLITRKSNLKKSPKLTSFLSREGMIVLSNWSFIILTFMVLLGTTYPIFTSLIANVEITVGQEFFNITSTPFFLLIIILTGLGMSTPWRRASISAILKYIRIPLILSFICIPIFILLGSRKPYSLSSYVISFFLAFIVIAEFIKGAWSRRRALGESFPKAFFNIFLLNRRKYGGYLVHLGVAITAIGIIGSSAYKFEKEYTIKKGETFVAKDYTLQFDDISVKEDMLKTAVVAHVSVYKNGSFVGALHPERRFYKNWEEPNSEVDIIPTIKGDLYLTLLGWEEGGDPAFFHIYINPLIQWVWIGCTLLVIGGFISITTRTRRKWKS